MQPENITAGWAAKKDRAANKSALISCVKWIFGSGIGHVSQLKGLLICEL